MMPLLIDCDPGIDDAVALLLAMASPVLGGGAVQGSDGAESPGLDILGITTVAGNVGVATTQINARCICELGGRPDLKVFAGCPRPLVRQPVFAEHVHGVNGLAGVEFSTPQMPLQLQHGVDFLIETLLQSPQKVAIATLGPLTNLAVALIKAPQIAEKIDRVVIMGGAVGAGNVTSSAEFNFFADPHAAQVVLQAGLDQGPDQGPGPGLNLTLIPLDVTHQAIATPARRAALAELGTRAGRTVAQMLGSYGVREQGQMGFAGPPLHDPCVIAYLLQPDLFEVKRCFAAIETESSLTLGRLVVAREGDGIQTDGIHGGNALGVGNVAIAQSIDADGFYRLLTTRLAGLE